jgi:hypothetical protein
VELPEVEGPHRIPGVERLVGDDDVVARVGVDLRTLAPLPEVLDGQVVEVELPAQELEVLDRWVADVKPDLRRISWSMSSKALSSRVSSVPSGRRATARREDFEDATAAVTRLIVAAHHPG